MQTRQTTSLPCQQFTVGQGNWNSDRAPIIHSIILHTMVGTVDGANARFNTPNSQVSAHYGIGLDGKLYQWVDEDNVAFHAGNYLVNQSSIGIEHEDGTNPQTNPQGYNNPRPDALYETSAKLVADICKFYDFPADTDHIFRHEDVIDKQFYPGGTSCPDALDTNRIIRMANEILNPPPPPPVTPEQAQAPIPAPSVQSVIDPNQLVQNASEPVVASPVPQSEAVTTPTLPEQPISQPSEASSEPSGQAGKVPFLVEKPISAPIKANPLFLQQMYRLIIWLLHLVGIERKEA
ncbi:MAG TPA: N-acetylmuramoyl-L-alanine amidase [Clostridia bacterium]